jgi:lysophospholipase L1-like esterase
MGLDFRGLRWLRLRGDRALDMLQLPVRGHRLENDPDRRRGHMAVAARGWVRVGMMVLAPALALVVLLGSAARASAYPNSMDALGDSITRAFNTCPTEFTDCPENSWATGTNKEVDSYYLRLLAKNPEISGKEYNDAVSGSKMSELNSQALKAVSRKVELVGIFMGNNDACTSSISTMTSTSTFESEFKTAMATLNSELPGAAIKVASLANAYRLWEIFHGNSSATATWKALSVCQSLLANPTSMAAADVKRREEFKMREEEYDTVLEKVCAKYTQCEFDKDAGFKTKFETSDVTTRDYFHPNIAGQTLIASTAWSAVGY